MNKLKEQLRFKMLGQLSDEKTNIDINNAYNVAVDFGLGYSEIDLWSLTTVDAYRTPTAKIVTKEELDKFLNDW